MIDTLAGWLLLLCVVIWVLATRIGAALAWIDRRNAETDAQAAADFDSHIAEAIALTQADIDADEAWDELEFMAKVLATIDELPEVRHG